MVGAGGTTVRKTLSILKVFRIWLKQETTYQIPALPPSSWCDWGSLTRVCGVREAFPEDGTFKGGCFDWCGSVGWASSCRTKGCGFGSWSGYMPGLWVGSLVLGTNQRQMTDVSFSLSSSFHFSLKINKVLKKRAVFIIVSINTVIHSVMCMSTSFNTHPRGGELILEVYPIQESG